MKMIPRTLKSSSRTSKSILSVANILTTNHQNINSSPSTTSAATSINVPIVASPPSTTNGTINNTFRHNSSSASVTQGIKGIKDGQVKVPSNRKFSCRPLNTEVMIKERRSLQWFYDHPLIDTFAKRKSVRLTPATILYTGTSCEDAHILKSASFLRKELPVRVAHWVNRFRSLPFIVGCNPIILGVHELYIRTFYLLTEFPEVNN